MKVLAIALVAAAVFVGDAAAQRPRPTDVPPGDVTTLVAPNDFQVYNDYATPARTYASRRAVVHYVVVGIDAPPLNDDDRDDVPDYVERVGAAADTAIEYFQRRGFTAIQADTGGPDARPDVYVSRFAPGSFGVAFPAADARGGAFVVVSNTLDPSAESSLGSLYGTVAHELFHLVQFSYFSPAEEPSIPSWVLEGSAAAMEGRVYAELDDIVSSLQLRRWFAQPRRRLTAQSYGAQLFWRYVDEREPRLLPAYLERLAAPRPGNAAPALAATYARVAGRPFAPVFGHFACWAAGEFAGRVTPVRSLRAGARARGRVAPLAIHYVRLAHGARTVRATRGELLYELRGASPGDASRTRRVAPRHVDGSLVFTIPRGARVGTVTLVVANGRTTQSLPYSVAVD
jgi:hypothetical protein